MLQENIYFVDHEKRVCICLGEVMIVNGEARILLGENLQSGASGYEALEALILTCISKPPYNQDHGLIDILPFSSGKLQYLLESGFEHISLHDIERPTTKIFP